MFDREKILKLVLLTQSKDVEEMTKKELIHLTEVLTDGFIDVYNDNVALANTLHDLWTPLYEISFTAAQAISKLKSCESEV